LVAQISHRQKIGIIADGHGRDNLLGIEKNRQRALFDHRHINRRTGMIHASDRAGQTGGMGVGLDNQRVSGALAHGQLMRVRAGMCKARFAALARPIAPLALDGPLNLS